MYLDTDERTNRIVMIGYAEQIKIINELIDTLDVPKYYIRYVREYFIQHIEAAEIVTAMNELGLAHVVVGDSSTTARTATPARQIPTRPGQPACARSAAQPAAAARKPPPERISRIFPFGPIPTRCWPTPPKSSTTRLNW